MTALFGFTGPPDASLADRVAGVLAHRGGRTRLVRETPSATVGVLDHFDETEIAAFGTGVYADDGWTIAVAGQFSTAPGEQPVPLADRLVDFRTKGPDCLPSWHGAFVAAIGDGRRVWLVRDGSGIRTLYYGVHAGRLIFGSEPKAVLAQPGFPRRLRVAALAQYMAFSFVPGEGTMLRDVFEVPAGHWVSCDCEKPEPTTRRYFVFEEPGRNGETDERLWVDRFREEFGAAVEERLPANETVGIFLSGGLDSSIVTAEVARRHRHPVKTYAIHFGEQYPNELAFAQAVAERCGTDHEEVLIEPRDFLPRMRRMIWHLDEPIGDPITIPNFELAARVSQDVRWVFNGEGGDPCFGGPKNIPMLLQHWYGGVPRDDRFRERAYLASYRRCYDEVTRLLSPDALREIDEERDLAAVLSPFFADPGTPLFLDKLAAINIRLKGAHLILPKVERMTAAWGLTPLAPLFDESIVRFSFAMPSTLRLARGIEKVVLKRAYEGDLPAEVVHRPKSGMRVPVHYWFQKELRRYAKQILGRRSVKSVGLFDPDRVSQLLNYDTEEGPGRYGLRLWMLITFELWRRIVVEGESP